jgi:hypothetical protein
MSPYKGSSKYHGPSKDGVTETVDPGNGSDANVSEDTDVAIINPDGTNSVVPDNAATAGRTLTVVHNGGASTPTLSFADADFVGTGPSNITSAGATATLLNTDGTTSGWVVVATGSA